MQVQGWGMGQVPGLIPAVEWHRCHGGAGSVIAWNVLVPHPNAHLNPGYPMLLIRLPANVPARQQMKACVQDSLPPTQETNMEFLPLALAWPSSSYRRDSSLSATLLSKYNKYG